MLTMVIARSLRFSAAPAPHRRNASARLCSSDSARRNTTRVVSSSSSVSRRREATSRHRRKAAKANLCWNRPATAPSNRFLRRSARAAAAAAAAAAGTRRRGGRRRREVKHAVAPREKMVRRARPVAQRREAVEVARARRAQKIHFTRRAKTPSNFLKTAVRRYSTVQYPSCPRARVQYPATPPGTALISRTDCTVKHKN